MEYAIKKNENESVEEIKGRRMRTGESGDLAIGIRRKKT